MTRRGHSSSRWGEPEAEHMALNLSPRQLASEKQRKSKITGTFPKLSVWGENQFLLEDKNLLLNKPSHSLSLNNLIQLSATTWMFLVISGPSAYQLHSAWRGDDLGHTSSAILPSHALPLSVGLTTHTVSERRLVFS